MNGALFRGITQERVMKPIREGRALTWNIQDIFEGTSIERTSEAYRCWADPRRIGKEDLDIIYQRLGISLLERIKIERGY